MPAERSAAPPGSESCSPCPVCGAQAPRRPEPDRAWALGFRPPVVLEQCGACTVVLVQGGAAANPVRYDADYFRPYEAVDPGTRRNRARLGEFRRRQAWLGARTSGRRLLDIGVGNGDFLLLARDAGFAAEGLDISAFARARLDPAGIPLHVGDALAHLAGQPAAYDIVHMNHSLEHMPDPRSVLRAVHAALRPGGWLYVEVPNEFDNLHYRLLERLGRKRPRGSWLGRSTPPADPSPHLYFFNRRSLTTLARAAGFAEPAVDARHRSDLVVDDPVWALYWLAAGIGQGPFLTLVARREPAPGR